MNKIKKFFLSNTFLGVINMCFGGLQLFVLILYSTYLMDSDPSTKTNIAQLISSSCFVFFHTFNLCHIIKNPLQWWGFFSKKKIWLEDLTCSEKYADVNIKKTKIKEWLDETVKHYVIVDGYSRYPYSSECVVFLKTEDMVLFKLTWFEGDNCEAY